MWKAVGQQQEGQSLLQLYHILGQRSRLLKQAPVAGALCQYEDVKQPTIRRRSCGDLPSSLSSLPPPPAFLPASYPPCLPSFFLSFLDRISFSFCLNIPNARFIGVNRHAWLSWHTNTKHIGHPGCVHSFLSGNSALGTCFTLGTRALTVATWLRASPCVWNWKKHKNIHPQNIF